VKKMHYNYIIHPLICSVVIRDDLTTYYTVKKDIELNPISYKYYLPIII
jgi:hypothetical protein